MWMRRLNFHQAPLFCRMRAVVTALTATLMLSTPAAPALEINGRTSFVAVPTRAQLINYRTGAFSGGAEFYLVLELPSGADAGLGGIDLSQIRGVQSAFYYGPVQPTAFLGRPRRQGASIPVNARFSDENRSVAIHFEKPVPPGETVTVAFAVGINPPADFYTFSVAALPWGPQAIPQTVGVVQMGIDEFGGL